MIDNENTPDHVERSILDAEQKAFYTQQAAQEARRVDSLTPEECAAEWDHANEASIARGDGPLPF